VFAARVGYDAEAYVGLLTRLRDLKGDDRALFKTHPNFSARIEAVQKTIQGKHLAATGVLLQERFSRMTKRI
jgi:predicted Zn-dependent protease